MMEYTDRHLRHLISLVSPSIELWTEMITSPAIVFTSQNDPSITDRLLKNSPLITDAARLHNVIQIGGSDPKQLAAATTIIKNSPHVYTGINLNCGCPSEKVSGKGCFGAALMLDASLVSSCVKAMITAEGSRDLPVSVKCRIGTDDNDDYETLRKFVEEVHVNGGCNEFQVHARVAILRKNFSPADNRNIPPLHYEHVYRLKRDFPHLVISLNGGVDSLSEALDVFENCPELDGVMVGRSLAAQPWSWSMADEFIYGAEGGGVNTRRLLLEEYGKHADAEEMAAGSKSQRRRILRPITTLFTGEPNGKRFRVALDALMKTAGNKRGKYMNAAKIEEGEEKLSELIMKCATDCLSEAILDQTREQAFEMGLLRAERGSGGGGTKNDGKIKNAISDWNKERKEQEKENKLEEEEEEEEELAEETLDDESKLA